MFKHWKKTFFIFFVLVFGIYFLINNSINTGKTNFLENLLSQKQKNFIKKNFFPHKDRDRLYGVIALMEEDLAYQQQTNSLLDYIDWIDLELRFKKSLKDIETKKILSTKLDNNLDFRKFKLVDGFYAGRARLFPGTGYLDFHNNNLIVLSARGILGFSEKINEELYFKQINNNLTNFINREQYDKNKWFALKDLHISNNHIFISYDEEMKTDCWNKSVVWGKMDYDDIKFEKLFSSKKCVHSINNIDKEFRAFQSGGRVFNFDENNVLLSVGEYRSRHLAQEKDNINGKVIKININDKSYKIVSMGHRNPQGLFFDKENGYILETEHGPMGADEINLIEIDKFKKGEIQNYGWAISSAGIHYGAQDGVPNKSYEKYPLYKSHKDHGFIEPLKVFTPAIGISQITKIKKKSYVASSLKDKSLYFFELNDKNNIVNLKRVEVFERIRDIKIKGNKLYLFLEDTASIGIITL